jgi:hypothetical protein
MFNKPLIKKKKKKFGNSCRSKECTAASAFRVEVINDLARSTSMNDCCNL